GPLSYTLSRSRAGALRLELGPGLRPPPGGVAVRPPLAGPLARVPVDGAPHADFDAEEVGLRGAPATIVPEGGGPAAGLVESQRRGGVPRDHAPLVGRDHVRRDAAVRARDARAVTRVGVRVEREPEPGRRLADAAADLDGVLADARREDQPV